ncbi:hypothetical protein FRC08_018569 [Ceratobasidium sp. 394]|nr:hypothetical protein FRC08_018569 [Ceratobasidium sp. 394]KAG9091206.1 hypothetical protein FS749_016717 [Ceratobasidium sp. UAMH 11750]
MEKKKGKAQVVTAPPLSIDDPPDPPYFLVYIGETIGIYTDYHPNVEILKSTGTHRFCKVFSHVEARWTMENGKTFVTYLQGTGTFSLVTLLFDLFESWDEVVVGPQVRDAALLSREPLPPTRLIDINGNETTPEEDMQRQVRTLGMSLAEIEGLLGALPDPGSHPSSQSRSLSSSQSWPLSSSQSRSLPPSQARSPPSRPYPSPQVQSFRFSSSQAHSPSSSQTFTSRTSRVPPSRGATSSQVGVLVSPAYSPTTSPSRSSPLKSTQPKQSPAKRALPHAPSASSTQSRPPPTKGRPKPPGTDAQRNMHRQEAIDSFVYHTLQQSQRLGVVNLNVELTAIELLIEGLNSRRDEITAMTQPEGDISQANDETVYGGTAHGSDEEYDEEQYPYQRR